MRPPPGARPARRAPVESLPHAAVPRARPHTSRRPPHKAATTTSTTSTSTTASTTTTTSALSMGSPAHHGVRLRGARGGWDHHRRDHRHQHRAFHVHYERLSQDRGARSLGSGAPLNVTMVNGLSVTLSPPANAPPSPVAVAPSSTAQFAYQYSDVPTGSETSCPTSETAGVTLPGATTSSPLFRLSIAPCNGGTIRVSPVYPTTYGPLSGRERPGCGPGRHRRARGRAQPSARAGRSPR